MTNDVKPFTHSYVIHSYPFQGGMYILQLVDWYMASFATLLISFSEAVGLAWFYGMNLTYLIKKTFHLF